MYSRPKALERDDLNLDELRVVDAGTYGHPVWVTYCVCV
jgi:hypothetical protein